MNLSNRTRSTFSLFTQNSLKQLWLISSSLTRHLTFFALILATLPAIAESLAIVDAKSIREQLVKDFSDNQEVSKQENIQRFYAQRDYQPIWITSDSPTGLLDVALALIERADEEGLVSDDYRSDYLKNLRRGTVEPHLLSLELAITRALLMLAHDLYSGRLIASLADPDWYIPQPKFDSVTFLQQALSSEKLEQAFTGLLPAVPQYHLLKQLLHKFRLVATANDARIPIPEETLSIRPYGRHVSIPLIRQRILEAYRVFEKPEYNITVTADNNNLYDSQLETAIKTFQRQYGLNADGIIGKNTRRALNMTPGDHIQQLRISLERLRWLPKKLGSRYVLVNVAGFNLIAIENGEQVLDMRIVVGRDYRSTPSFSSKISYLVLNPYWNVPRSIASKDLLPKQRNNPNYFASEGIRVFSDYQYKFELSSDDVDWSSSDQFPYVLRQDPGRKNALGTIKFMFPNPFSIYLHDTPSKNLFQKDIRTFSSGCIRLEKPIQLAEFVLGQAFEQTDIVEKISSGKTQTVNLSERMPVYLLYLTAWIDSQNEVHFSSDVYGRDKRALAYANWQ